jgi:hypothetical protein
MAKRGRPPRKNTSNLQITDRSFAFITGLAISAVAAYYAISGLAAIFAGAVIPIIIMGSVLEIGKIITASYLYRNWKNMPFLMKSYFMCAVAVLMLITSMGVFGYLSRAHIEQTAPVSDVSASIERIDQNIVRERQRITSAEKVITQLDAAIDKFISVEQVTRGLEARKNQAKERETVRIEIADAQKNIDRLLDERVPLAQKVRSTEVEVGPIRYVAELIYGTSTQDVLDRSVRIMIIALVMVLDPLALLLIISVNRTSPVIEASNRNGKKWMKLWLSENNKAVDARNWEEVEDITITKKK